MPTVDVSELALPQAESGTSRPLLSDPAQSVMSALRNPNYVWRTVDGIARETGLDKRTVADVLRSTLADVIVRNSATDDKGRFLFATRKRYLARRSLKNRILSVLSDQVR